MIRFLIFSILLLLLAGCAQSNRKVDFEYIKVIYSGYGNSGYAYFDPIKDSLICQMTYAEDTLTHKTLKGRIANSRLLDTFINTVRTLKQFKNGSITMQLDEGDFYCGPSIYTEFKDAQGIHFYSYDLEINDTLDQFIHFTENLQRLNWSLRESKNELVNFEGELKSANSKMLSTFKKGTFYFALSCSTGIDFTKLYGSWRFVSDSVSRTKNEYRKLTIKKNGTCIFERMLQDSVLKRFVGKVSLNTADSSLVFSEYDKEYRYILTQLCDNCLQYRSENEHRIIRLDRTDETKSAVRK
jgi:hypothetical protein